MENTRRVYSELRLYAQLKYPYVLKQDEPGLGRKPEILFRWIENKLGRLLSEDMARMTEDEDGALEKALSAREARRGVGAVERRCTGGEDDEEPFQENEGTQRMTKRGLRKKYYFKFDKAAGANELII